jgi:uncharacterized membrane protein YukC
MENKKQSLTLYTINNMIDQYNDKLLNLTIKKAQVEQEIDDTTDARTDLVRLLGTMEQEQKEKEKNDKEKQLLIE